MTGKPEARAQPMPLDRSILWNPASKGGRVSGRAPYPVFFQQEAVVALQDHLKATPQQAIFGFLAGELLRDPETGVLYAVIDKTLRLNQAIYGDKTEVVVARLWERMQEQLARAAGARLLGWYHSHPGHPLALSTHDVETHEKYFSDPWHVAVVVALEAEGVTGAFFRAGSGAAWTDTPLPFYELLQPDSIRDDGKKRSFIVWRNYKAYNPVPAKRTPPPAPAPPRPPSPPPKASPVDDLPIIRSSADDEPAPAPAPAKQPAAPVFVPDRASAPPPAPPPRPAPPAPPAPPPRPARPAATPTASRERPSGPRRKSAPAFRLLDQPPRRRSRRGFWLTLLAVLLIVAGGVAAGYYYYFLRPGGTGLEGLKRLVVRTAPGAAAPAAPASTPRRPAADTALARFDRLSDTLSRAVRNYHERAALFARGRSDCVALAQGLVAVEGLWTGYNRQRRAVVASFDPARAARDRALDAGVDSVESQFDGSRCRRP